MEDRKILVLGGKGKTGRWVVERLNRLGHKNVRIGVLSATTLTTGLLAGIFFTWTNAVTTGIGRLDDLGYLNAFQSMNRAIINPLFYVVIIGPLFLQPWSIYLYKNSSGFVQRALLGATALYFLGVFAVTMFGNIPLNILLEKAQLNSISLEDAKALRNEFERSWNGFHLVRTITSSASFLLLILACLSSTEGKSIVHQSIQPSIK